MSRTLIFSLAVGGYQHLFHQCLNSQYAYSSNNSYDYAVVTSSPWSLKAHDAAWLKVPLLIAASQLNYEWIAFIDADCEIRSYAQPIQTVFRERKLLYLAPGISKRINSGVIIIKNEDERVSNILRKIFDNADSNILPENKAPYENGHFIQYIKDCDFFSPLEHKKWNNNSNLDNTSFIQHYSGKNLREYYKKEHITRYQKIQFGFNKHITKIIKKIPQSFLNESSTKKRLDMLVNAYNQPLESLITQSIR